MFPLSDDDCSLSQIEITSLPSPRRKEDAAARQEADASTHRPTSMFGCSSVAEWNKQPAGLSTYAQDRHEKAHRPATLVKICKVNASDALNEGAYKLVSTQLLAAAG